MGKRQREGPSRGRARVGGEGVRAAWGEEGGGEEEGGWGGGRWPRRSVGAAAAWKLDEGVEWRSVGREETPGSSLSCSDAL